MCEKTKLYSHISVDKTFCRSASAVSFTFPFSENSIMVKTTKVEGFEAFESKVTELSGSGGDVFVMFSGSKNADGIR